MRFETHWQEARVRSVRDLTPRIRALEIEPATGARPYAPGSHIDVRVFINDAPDIRSYSLVGEGPVRSAYRIAIQRAAASRGGSEYMWSLAPSGRLLVSEPQNLFALTLDRPEYLLIAGGIGITPIYGMACALESLGARFRLLYAGRRRTEMAFVEELRERLGSRLTLCASEENRRIDLCADVRRLHPEGELYLCGPMRLIDAARAVWRASGRPPARLRFETFASSGRNAPEPFLVRVPDRGIEVLVPENKTMLAALQEAGVEVLSDCLRGECGLCALNVLEAEGELDHRDVFLTEDQKAARKKICACVSRVAGGCISVDTGFRTNA